MLWFHRDQQARFKRRYNARVASAELLRRDLGLQRLLAANLVLVQQAFQSADADPHEFAQTFGEPMPEHLALAVHLETDLWVAIHTTLEGAKNAKLAPEEYKRLVPRLRLELQTMLKLLALEKEILYSPLSKHFHRQLATLRSGSP